MMLTYLLMGLTFLITNTLILAAIKAPNGGSWWVWLIVVPGYILLWPVVMGFWVYRVVKPLPSMDVRRIPKRGDKGWVEAPEDESDCSEPWDTGRWDE